MNKHSAYIPSVTWVGGVVDLPNQRYVIQGRLFVVVQRDWKCDFLLVHCRMMALDVGPSDVIRPFLNPIT